MLLNWIQNCRVPLTAIWKMFKTLAVRCTIICCNLYLKFCSDIELSQQVCYIYHQGKIQSDLQTEWNYTALIYAECEPGTYFVYGGHVEWEIQRECAGMGGIFRIPRFNPRLFSASLLYPAEKPENAWEDISACFLHTCVSESGKWCSFQTSPSFSAIEFLAFFITWSTSGNASKPKRFSHIFKPLDLDYFITQRLKKNKLCAVKDLTWYLVNWILMS